MNPSIWFNGQIAQANHATVPTTDLALLYGVGLFETMRSYDGTVFRWDAHMARLQKSAEALHVPAQDAELPSHQDVATLLEANGLSDARVRLTVTGGIPGADLARPNMVMTAVAAQPYADELYTDGATVHICRAVQDPNDPLIGHKTISTWARLQALHAAQRHGCIEALWFTPDRHLAEGCISNVFCVRDGTVRTPPVATPVLPGITRAVILERCAHLGIPTEQASLTIEDLLDAHEVFLTNVMMAVVPVCRIERSSVGDEALGVITQRLADDYHAIVRHETAP